MDSWSLESKKQNGHVNIWLAQQRNSILLWIHGSDDDTVGKNESLSIEIRDLFCKNVWVHEQHKLYKNHYNISISGSSKPFIYFYRQERKRYKNEDG